MEKELKYKQHRERTNLAGEHVWGDTGQLILFLLFLVVWIGDSFILHYSTFLSNYISIYIRLLIALVILSSSVYCVRSGHRMLFDEISQQPMVIRKGIFNRVRHPLYLGSLLFYLGLTVLTPSIMSFILWIGIFVFYHFISRFEEKLLLDKFGEEYEKYINEVPMWIPRLSVLN